MSYELRFYKGRQLSDYEKEVVARYKEFLATTKLGKEDAASKPKRSQATKKVVRRKVEAAA